MLQINLLKVVESTKNATPFFQSIKYFTEVINQRFKCSALTVFSSSVTSHSFNQGNLTELLTKYCFCTNWEMAQI